MKQRPHKTLSGITKAIIAAIPAVILILGMIGSGLVKPAQVSANSQANTAAAPVNPLEKEVLNKSHFTYLGKFRMPTKANGGSTAFATAGLTHRYVNGQLRFISAGERRSGGLVYETNYPGLGDGRTVPQAQVVREWGDVYGGRKWVGNDGGTAELGNAVWTLGLNYDQQLKRLYWNYGYWYNASHPLNPSFGYSILDDATGTTTAFGPWSLEGRLEKFARGGTTRIPQWFADRYTGGRTLGVGFGGSWSIQSTCSVGAALTAIADPGPADPSGSALPGAVPLVGYPWGEPGLYDRMHRDPDVINGYDYGKWMTTNNGEDGYWNLSDTIYGAGVWIDTPAVHGVLILARVGQGQVWYENATVNTERGRYEWFVFDPKDLADVATGVKREWQIQPKHRWTDPTLPINPYDAMGWIDDGLGHISGATYDATTNRLYLLGSGAWHEGVEWYPMVYAYQLGSAGSSEPLPWTPDPTTPNPEATPTTPVDPTDDTDAEPPVGEPNAPEEYNSAAFVSQSIPSRMIAGRSYNASVTVQNTGTTTWTSTAEFRLGSQNPRDNDTLWAGRVDVPHDVAPGQTVTFNFILTAPSQPATYNFQSQVVQEMVEWFGDLTPNVAINVVAPPAVSRVPAAPSHLLVSFQEPPQTPWTGMALKWADNASNEEGYEVERRQQRRGGSFTSFKLIRRIDPTTLSYPDLDVKRGETYEYRVRAYNARGKSAYSNIFRVTAQ